MGLPLVLMEAMARGRVVLAPAITGIPELVIDGQTGFLYPPDKRGVMVRATRATLHRAKLTYQEVQTLRGMIVALAKGKHRGEK